MIFEFGGHGRDDDFEISEGKRGLKYSCHLWQGMDIFWNHPMQADIYKCHTIQCFNLSEHNNSDVDIQKQIKFIIQIKCLQL